jgi:hypothetical protein
VYGYDRESVNIADKADAFEIVLVCLLLLLERTEGIYHDTRDDGEQDVDKDDLEQQIPQQPDRN